MKDWFKARNIWGAAITALTDEEAGRLAKAIWTYTMTGEIVEIDGAGKGIFAMILMTIGQDAEKDGEISAKRSAVGSLGGKQKVANATNCNQLQSIATNCNQLLPNADNKNKNKNKNKNIEQEQESESELITDAEAQEIQSDQNKLLDAAEDAGFQRSNSVRARLLKLYADYGLEKVLDGIDSCVRHSASNLAYLEACLKGDPKKPKAKVIAQDYNQRDYTSVDNELQDSIDDLMAEWKKGAS